MLIFYVKKTKHLEYQGVKCCDCGLDETIMILIINYLTTSYTLLSPHILGPPGLEPWALFIIIISFTDTLGSKVPTINKGL